MLPCAGQTDRKTQPWEGAEAEGILKHAHPGLSGSTASPMHRAACATTGRRPTAVLCILWGWMRRVDYELPSPFSFSCGAPFPGIALTRCYFQCGLSSLGFIVITTAIELFPSPSNGLILLSAVQTHTQKQCLLRTATSPKELELENV